MGRRRAALTAALALMCGLAVVVPAATASGEHREPAAGHRRRRPARSRRRRSTSTLRARSRTPSWRRPTSPPRRTAAARRNPTLPTGFSDQKVISGITEAISADFAPDGTAFVALKTGVIKISNYNGSTTWSAATVTSPTSPRSEQLRRPRPHRHRRGPAFPTRPYVYVNYTYNKDPRDGPNGVVPKWGVPGQAYDDCPAPAIESNPSIAGCVVQDRVTRLTAVKSGSNWVMQTEKELLVGGCFQFGSHASGDVAFGPDGKLYASSGEGASFVTLDHGQYSNPCADPDERGRLAALPGLPDRVRTRPARSRRQRVQDEPGHRRGPHPGRREQLAGRLRPAQPVAAHLPAQGRREWTEQRALVRRRRSQQGRGGQPDRQRHHGAHPDQPGLALLRGQLPARRCNRAGTR